MTANCNGEWDYEKLQQGVVGLEKAKSLARLTGGPSAKYLVDACQHTIDFIEYNMKEMEIDGGNGD